MQWRGEESVIKPERGQRPREQGHVACLKRVSKFLWDLRTRKIGAQSGNRVSKGDASTKECRQQRGHPKIRAHGSQSHPDQFLAQWRDEAPQAQKGSEHAQLRDLGAETADGVGAAAETGGLL